ncbi:MAG TPA: hypothetical protein VM238_22425 [Phycisphaerae bacterium]|nr:hypothetical protein [Phycisphaerae bacterium]
MGRILEAVVGVAALAVALAAGCQSETRSPGGLSPSDLRELKSARFQATIWETRLPAERIGKVDAKTLASADDIQRALEALGATRALYQIDQVIDLAKAQIKVGKREPFVTGTRTTQAGGTINMVEYQEIGVIVQVSAKPTDRGPAAKVEVEMSALTDSATPIAEKVPAVSIHHGTLRHNGPVELGRPVVMASVDASTRDAQGRAIAYVCRIVFSAPAP